MLFRSHQKAHSINASELCLTEDNLTSHLLDFLSNDAKLFQIVQHITGCTAIGCFEGRVYRMIPGHGHYDSWHNDMVEQRMVAMSINLSTEVYSGGVLQICEWPSRRILHEVANIGFGDSIIFRLSHHLKHRVTEVAGTVPKTAFAGWFKSQPDFLSLLTEGRDTILERD